MPALLLWTKRLTIFAPQEHNPWINSFKLPWSKVSSISWNLTLLFVCLCWTWAIVFPSLSSLFFSIDTNPSTGVIYQESQWVAQEMLNRAHALISHNDLGKKHAKQLILSSLLFLNIAALVKLPSWRHQALNRQDSCSIILLLTDTACP